MVPISQTYVGEAGESLPIRAAVVGVGSMGRNHARVYKELPGVELAAIVRHFEIRKLMLKRC